MEMMEGMAGRYAAVDVYYPPSGGAVAALVVARDRRFATTVDERQVALPEVNPYQPGNFAARELPALRAVLAGVDALELLIVDGYVHLDPEGRPGLGAHAHAEFGIPVIGVAKSRFRSASHAVEVRRGRARKPLFVTAAGVPVDRAAAVVRHMTGEFRLPDALRRVDALSRTPSHADTQSRGRPSRGPGDHAPAGNAPRPRVGCPST